MGLEFYIDIKAADNNLEEVGNWIMIRCKDADGDSISAERISEATVSILTLSVNSTRENQGRATALVQRLFDELPVSVNQVTLKTNDNPGFWTHIKHKIKGGNKLVL
jgi:hypothetical protein